MKKILSLFITLLLLKLSFAQTPGLFKFTQSELSGNGPTIDSTGYEFNFNNGSYGNCNADLYLDPLLNRAGNFFATNNTISFDSTNGYADITSKSTPSRYFANFIKSNCSYLSEGINVSDPSNLFIEIKFKSSLPLNDFSPSFCESSTGYLNPLNYCASTNPINANEWNTIKFDFSNISGNPTLSEIVGFSYQADANVTWDHDFNVNPLIITIDYIKIGSAVNNVTNVKADGFTIDNLNKVNCGRFFNVLNNPNFTYSYDSNTQETVFEQLDATASNQYVANIFSNQNCFFSFVDFSDPATQLVNVSIMPDNDIPYFSVDINGYTTAGIWDVGKITKYIALKKGEWNNITLPLNLETPNNTTLDPKRITGFGLIFDSIRTAAPKVAATSPINTFKVKEVMIGSTAKTTYSTNTTSILSGNLNYKNIQVYPNPSFGNINFQFPFSNGDVTIFNSLGVEVKHFTSINASVELNTGLEKGIYTIMIKNSDSPAQGYISKLVVQ